MKQPSGSSSLWKWHNLWDSQVYSTTDVQASEVNVLVVVGVAGEVGILATSDGFHVR